MQKQIDGEEISLCEKQVTLRLDLLFTKIYARIKAVNESLAFTHFLILFISVPKRGQLSIPQITVLSFYLPISCRINFLM